MRRFTPCIFEERKPRSLKNKVRLAFALIFQPSLRSLFIVDIFRSFHCALQIFFFGLNHEYAFFAFFVSL